MSRPLIFIVLDTPATALGLSANEKSTLCSLVSHVNAKRNGTEVWPSVERLALLTGIGERTVRRALRQLEQIGFIKTRSDSGKSNVYSIIPEVIHSLADPGHHDRGQVADPGHSDRGTPATMTGDPGHCGRRTAKEQPIRTAKAVSSFGCSTNPRVGDGPEQRKLAVHGLVAGAVKPVGDSRQEQPTKEKAAEANEAWLRARAGP